MRSKFHNEYMQMLSECIALYPRKIDPISFTNQYGFSRVKSFTNWLESNDFVESNYYPEWFREFLESPDFSNYEIELTYSQLQKIIRTSTDPTWTSAIVRYYAKTISPKHTLLENTKDLGKIVEEVDYWWGFNNLISEEQRDELDEENDYEDIINKIRVNKNTVSIKSTAIDDEKNEVFSISASIPRNIPTVIDLVRYLRDDLGSENWGAGHLATYIQLYSLFGWNFNLQPFDKYEDAYGDMELMWKLTRRIPKKKIDQLRNDANSEIRQIVQAIMNNNRKAVQPFIDFEDFEEMEDFEAENWGGDPEGQLAQALERVRNSPAPPPLEITELPKICQLCGDESPQAFGLYDEDDQLLGEIWACDGGCAQPLADSRNLSFGAEGDYNEFIEGLEAHLTQFGNLDHLDSEYGEGILSGSFSVDIDEPDKFGEVDFDAEGDIDNFHKEPIMVIGESTNLPDADSWIIYMHDTDEREQDSRFADLFFVRGPGQFIRTSNYQKTAKVIGGYAPFHITQNLSRDGWLASSTTIVKYTDEPDARSLSVGDVVCDADTGRCFIVANSGYLPLEPTELFEAPLARHSINRFKKSTAPKKAGYWRKKGKESIFRRNKSSSSGE